MATAAKAFQYGYDRHSKTHQFLFGVTHNGNTGCAIENYSGVTADGQFLHATGQRDQGKRIQQEVHIHNVPAEYIAA